MNKADKEEQKKKFEEKIKELQTSMSGELGEIARARHQTALAKIPQTIDIIKVTLENENKIVVFTHHKDVMKKIKEEFEDIAVTYHGEKNNEEKEEAVYQFQNNNSKRLFIATTQSAGTGITLTQASTEIFVELEWTPSDMNQAEDRCHRIGQENAVNIYHIVVNDSIDADLSQQLIDKQKIIDQVTK